jgi:hypothetical protein
MNITKVQETLTSLPSLDFSPGSETDAPFSREDLTVILVVLYVLWCTCGYIHTFFPF